MRDRSNESLSTAPPPPLPPLSPGLSSRGPRRQRAEVVPAAAAVRRSAGGVVARHQPPRQAGAVPQHLHLPHRGAPQSGPLRGFFLLPLSIFYVFPPPLRMQHIQSRFVVRRNAQSKFANMEIRRVCDPASILPSKNLNLSFCRTRSHDVHRFVGNGRIPHYIYVLFFLCSPTVVLFFARPR